MSQAEAFLQRLPAPCNRCSSRAFVPLQEEGITELLMAPAKLKDQIPGICGTRALSDNLSDLKAQVAANNKGIGLVGALIEEYTLEVVQAYMHHIQVRPAVFVVPRVTACYGWHQPKNSLSTLHNEESKPQELSCRL